MEIILIIIIAIIIGLITFTRPTIGLGLVLLSCLFFPEIQIGKVQLGVIQTREVTIRPEDFFIILVALGWFANSVIRFKSPVIIHTPLNIPIVVFSLVVIIATILGIAQGTTTLGGGFFYALKRIQYFLVFFLVIANIKTLDEVKKGIFLLLFFSIVVALWGIIKYSTVQAQRIEGPFMRAGEYPVIGGFFLITVFLSLGFFLKHKYIGNRFLMLLVIILSVLVIIFTQTRSSYIGLYLGLIIFALVFRKFFLLVIPLLLIIFMNYLLPPLVAERVISIRGIWQGKLAPSWEARKDAWKSAIPEIKSYPLLGQGAGAYSLSWFDNQYVIDIIYTGIIGLVVFIYLMILIFIKVYSLTKIPQDTSENQYISALAMGYSGVLIALLIHSIAVTTFYNIRTMIPFWFLTGLLMVANHTVKEKL
jgi:O-antigen ligase